MNFRKGEQLLSSLFSDCRLETDETLPVEPPRFGTLLALEYEVIYAFRELERRWRLPVRRETPVTRSHAEETLQYGLQQAENSPQSSSAKTTEVGKAIHKSSCSRKLGAAHPEDNCSKQGTEEQRGWAAYTQPAYTPPEIQSVGTSISEVYPDEVC
mgnify:CR=1 FL=1